MNTEQLSFFNTINSQLDPTAAFEALADSMPPESIAVLEHYGFLAVEGPDTGKFLQGQTTCDLDKVSDTQAQLGAFCTVKGRTLSSFLIASDQQHHLLRMRRDLVATTAKAIAKYIVFSKATHTDASEDFTAIGLSGATAGSIIARVFGALPGGQYQSVSRDGAVAVQLDEGAMLFECWLPSDQLALLWPQLNSGQALLSAQHWQLLVIRQGCGEVSAATSELFIPQMLNYHLTGAISFTKGCYTGQEVIARMHYKGKLKRQLYRIALETKSIEPGDDLYGPNSEQSIGKIVNCIAVGAHRSEALAVITRANVDADNVLFRPQQAAVVGASNADEISQNIAVTILSLPYTLNEQT